MIGLLALATGTAATLGVTAHAMPVATADRVQIEKIIHDYILSHPEILPEAMDILRARDVAMAIAAHRAHITTPFASAWEGAADADVTLVEFFDYDCGFCRATLPDIDRLLREDNRLRIVYREFPVLGPHSDHAARISLAAARAGIYAAFHRAVYALGHLEPRAVDRIARNMGIDTKLAADSAFEVEIAANLDLARPLAMTGTPSWVIGDKVLIGAIGYDALKDAVAAARAQPPSARSKD